ncbi:MAG TPA: hypothetical protein PKL88_01505 [bacterium]|nr:hypothetical protein [bacterium]HPD73862.1 hypothetical protein [bacterium]HRY56927.1 hypothetical protein [Patescibacteria group bacterium]
MDKERFEEYGFVSYGWKNRVFIVRIEIPLSEVRGFEKNFLKGRVTLQAGGKVIGKACLKPLRLSLVYSEMSERDCLELVQYVVNHSIVIYEACIDVSPEECVKTDTTFKVKIGNLIIGPTPVGVPVTLP